MIYGYARVSTKEQDPQYQYDMLLKKGCNQIIVEKASGAEFKKRPQLCMLLDSLKEGDTLMVCKLDRLARSVKHLIELTDFFQKKGVSFISIGDNFDLSTPTGKVMFHMVAAIGEMQRDIIREASMLGLIAAKARGKRMGRPPMFENPAKYAIAERIVRLYDEGMDFTRISELMKMKYPTVHKYYKVMKGLQILEGRDK